MWASSTQKRTLTLSVLSCKSRVRNSKRGRQDPRNGRWALSTAPACANVHQTSFRKRCLRNHEPVTNRLGDRTQTPTPGSPASPAGRRERDSSPRPQICGSRRRVEPDAWRHACPVRRRLLRVNARRSIPENNPQLLSDDTPPSYINGAGATWTDSCPRNAYASRHA